MKKIILLTAIIMMASCSPVRHSVKNQRESVSLNKKQAKGLSKASKTVNARMSKEAYGR